MNANIKYAFIFAVTIAVYSDDLLTLPDSCDSIMGKSPRNLKRTQRSATSGRSEARDFNNTSTNTFQSDVTSRMRAGCSPVTHRQLLTLDPISMYCSSARYSRCQNDTSPYTGEYESGHLNGGGFRISRL
ncbi:unnamed protein product [Toxocara canis]|uniref:Uncharacterized protein n=1 Tax=Toxocara canis TaxID=6265 RepID=A0A183UZP7_TOXCA|nr:unnamed protein product [Toxocara canis]